VRFRIAFLAFVLAGLAVVGPAATATRQAKVVVPPPVKITVVAREFSFTFSKAKVKVGTTVTFKLVNKGQVEHNLVFTTLGKATALIQPGASTTLKVKFRKKGRFFYICSVPRHAERGMSGSFLVTA
jgi:uncharacterized cupredoxin-like copper-binding protein